MLMKAALRETELKKAELEGAELRKAEFREAELIVWSVSVARFEISKLNQFP